MRGLVFISLVILARGQPPIPATPPGIELGQSPVNAPVQLEIFVDPCCPYCKDTWPIMKLVKEHYGNSMRLLVHGFALPFHRNSFLTNQALYLVHDEVAKNSTFKLLEALFLAYPAFGNDQTADITPQEVLQELATLAQTSTKINQKYFTERMSASDAPYNYKTRIAWMYASTRGIRGTPNFLVNGVMVDADPTWTLKDWMKLLDPLVHHKESGWRRKQIFGIRLIDYLD